MFQLRFKALLGLVASLWQSEQEVISSPALMV